jgi:hypothetical protein
MARGNQTFKKRQRENKLREKAQLKRERRQQRQSEKKASLVLAADPQNLQTDSAEAGARNEPGFVTQPVG